jgi:uncharacterized protein
MKFILLLLVVGVVGWLISTRSRKPLPPPARPGRPPAGPSAVLACAHCGLHVVPAEVVRDAAGRPYCGVAHRSAGPAGP